MSDFTLDLTPRGTLAIDCVTNGPITTNTYFAVSGDEAVIIDPAWDGVELARHFALKHPGVRVVALLCTHGHADHLGGVAGLRRVLGEQVPYLLPAGDVRRWVNPSRNSCEAGISTRPIPASRTAC